MRRDLDRIRLMRMTRTMRSIRMIGPMRMIRLMGIRSMRTMAPEPNPAHLHACHPEARPRKSSRHTDDGRAEGPTRGHRDARRGSTTDPASDPRRDSSGYAGFWRVVQILVPLCVLWVTTGFRDAAAQFPGELAGRVTDAETGAPVEAASVEIPALGRRTLTDGSGAFRLRGLEPGSQRVTVRRTGFAPAEQTVEVRNGALARVTIELRALPVALEAVRAQAARNRVAEGERFGRERIEASGARTVAEVVERAGGVLVRGTGPTGERTASIRGADADAVLVLIDGVPANDPVTGVADLSSIPVHAVESVTVLPGARGARYGPRAEAGVILVETRSPDLRRAAEASLGTLDERSGAGEWGFAAGGARLSVGGSARRIGGVFRFERDPNDPQILRRQNADLDETGAFAALGTTLAGGELRARAGWESLDRGIPGLAFAPSTAARQEMERGRASLSWRRATGGMAITASAAGVAQRVRYADPAPPFGVPYDDTTDVRALDLRAEAERAGGGGLLRGWGGGIEARLQRVEATTLSDALPDRRDDLGAFAHTSLGRMVGRADVTLTAEGRMDRDGVTRDWRGSHALTLGADFGAVRLHAAHRSSFSPPALGDQFFREGVAVQANPGLLPERVPSEWEAGASVEETLGAVDLSAGASAFRSDVRGMIVWAPDFRFVWRPINLDTRRSGADVWSEVGFRRVGVTLSGAYTLARITYDREGGDDSVQVAYRPRHTGWVRAEWRPGPWRLEAGAAYTGTRYPGPSSANALPGFWSTSAGVSREVRWGGASLTATVRAERLLDEKDALIFGYPEPGRRVRVDLAARRAGKP